MDQIKIGKFIAERRKAEGLTQAQLAEQLGITDRAVSKWETGKALPDSSIMLDLCKILKITVNDLLSGEVVSMENYNEKLENNLMEMVRKKEKSDRLLLRIEIIFGAVCLAVLLAGCINASYTAMEEWVRLLLIFTAMAPLLFAAPFMLKIEQEAGYYQCAKCGHKYVPSYKSVFFSMHMGRTRHMRCPHCKEKSWQKKVISKD